MTAKQKNLYRIVVSLVFIVLGLASGIPALIGIIKGLPSIHLYAVIGLAVDVVMFFAGLLGLLKTNKSVCIMLSTILFVGYAVSAVLSIIDNASFWDVAFAILKAVAAWFYIGCIGGKTSTEATSKKGKKK